MLRPRFKSLPLTIPMGQKSPGEVHKMTDAIEKLAKWGLQKSKLDFAVIHRVGRKYQEGDAKLRLAMAGMSEPKLKDNAAVHTIT